MCGSLFCYSGRCTGTRATQCTRQSPSLRVFPAAGAGGAPVGGLQKASRPLPIKASEHAKKLLQDSSPKTLYETRNFFRAKTAPKGSGSLIFRNFPAQAATAFFQSPYSARVRLFSTRTVHVTIYIRKKMNRGNEPWIFMVPSARPAHSRRSCSTWWKPA